MHKVLGLAILAVLFGGCASTLPGKVVVVSSVYDARGLNYYEKNTAATQGVPSGGTVASSAIGTGTAMGGAAIQGAAAGGAALSSALHAGVAVGGVATVVDAIMNRDKTVTVYATWDKVMRSCNQKPTPEVFQLKPGDKAVFVLDRDGDLVLVPYMEKNNEKTSDGAVPAGDKRGGAGG